MKLLFFAAIAAIATASLGGCTFHPVIVRPKSIAYSEGVRNAGIIGYDKTGLIVNQDWIDKYDRLLEAFAQKLPADERVKPGDRAGVKAVGPDRYHVQFQVNDRFADLKYFERNAAP